MMKYGLLLCVLAGSNIVSASVLPAIIVRGLASSIKSCTALVVCKNDGFKVSPQETRKALLQEEKRLNVCHMEWTHHIEILKSALQAIEKERGIVTEQLCWIKAAQDRARGQLEDTQSNSPYEDKDLDAIKKKEYEVIQSILSVREMVKSFYDHGPNGSFWNSQRCAEVRAHYVLREHELYRELDQIRAYKQTLEREEQNK